MEKVSDDTRVRDLIRRGQLPVRQILGAATCRRLGVRGWERPNVAISGRLYRKHGVEDPWDPNSKHKGRSIGLGPVGLRLSEPRRQVAPHLKPRAPVEKKKKVVQAADPLARWRKKPSRSPAPPPPAPEPPPVSETFGTFGGTPRHAVRGKLPVRPDIDAPSSPDASVEHARGDRLRSRRAPPGPVAEGGGGRLRLRSRHVPDETPEE